MRAAFVLAAFIAMLVATVPTAGAATPCGRQVIDDWWDNGRIDGTYAEHCYDDAIEILPRDVRDYSSAKEDIERALQNKLRGRPAPPAKTDPTPEDDKASTKPSSTIPGNDQPGNDDPPTGTIATPPLDDSASSVPVPLLILAGLALLLVAGGSAGYLIRRFQNRRMPPPAV